MNSRHVLTGAMLWTMASAATAASSHVPELSARIDSIFAGYSAKGPGCAVGVERDGAVLFTKGFGAADIEVGRPLTPASRVYMASVSKQMAAMAALLLVEDGRLRLNDPVRKFIPELPAYADGVTVAQLLNHTSGVRDYFTLGALDGLGEDHPYTEGDVLRILARQQGLNFTPGSEFLYSNSGYVLVSIIVQRVSGQRLDDFARTRIFKPLGMAGSRFQHDHTAAIPDKANGYDRRGEQWRSSNSYLDVVGDGGLYSSVDDMLRWLANLDHPKVGSKALTIMRASARLNDGSPSGYGMGLETSVYRSRELVQHGGALAGYRTADWWFPKERLGVVVLCNRADARTGELAAHVADIFLPADAAPASSPPPATRAVAAGVAAYAGLYRDSKGGYIEFSARTGGLFVLRPDQPLTQTQPGRFVPSANLNGAALVFDGQDGVAIVQEGQPSRRYQRVVRAELGADAAGAYEGAYASPEAAGTIRIRQAAGGPLTLGVGDGARAPLVQTGPDRLWMPATGVEVTFARDGGGKVTGFTLNAGRARGLRYSKRAD